MRRGGQDRRHSQIFARSNVRSIFAKLARSATLAFEILPIWGFAEASHPSKRLGGLRRGFAGMGFANDGRLTISTLIVVKTAAIGNLGPGAHARSSAPSLRAGGFCVCAPHRQSRVPSRRPVMGIPFSAPVKCCEHLTGVMVKPGRLKLAHKSAKISEKSLVKVLPCVENSLMKVYNAW